MAPRGCLLPARVTVRIGTYERERELPSAPNIEGMNSAFIARDVACGSATGRMYDYGAHVTAWAPRSEQPVIWMPRDVDLVDGEPIRGGIPVCFPWFGAGPDNTKRPMHGLARVSRWLLVDSFLDEEADTHQLTYRLTPKRLGREDAQFEAIMQVTFGRELDQVLTVTNTGEDDFVFEEAFHTYISVGNAERVSVLGLDEANYLDWTVDDPTWQRQDLELSFTGETVDRVYDSTSPITIEDPNNARRIVLRKENSASTIVWNPGVEGCRGKEGLAKDDWKHFLCVEIANCKSHTITLEPGAKHEMRQTISIEHL